MAKAVVEDEEDQHSPDKVKVTPRSKPPLFTPSTPSDEYLDAEDNYDDNDLDDPMFAKLKKGHVLPQRKEAHYVLYAYGDGG